MSKSQQSFLPYMGVILAVLVIFLMSVYPMRQKNSANIPYYSVLNPDLDFSLTDQDGKEFHLRDHRGKVVLLFFGYLTCPDICPVTLSKISRVYQLLKDQSRNLQTVFVTIDPERDTPAKLKEYLQYFKLNVIGLTGSAAEIDKVVNAYKASYKKVEMDSEAGYLMDHSDLVYLIDPQGRVVDLIHFDDEASLVAQKLKKFL